MTGGSEAYTAKGREIAAAKRRRQRREAQQIAAKAQLGCEGCLASREDIRTEQARLKAATMARHPEWFA